jgi:hypothetical protein
VKAREQQFEPPPPARKPPASEPQEERAVAQEKIVRTERTRQPLETTAPHTPASRPGKNPESRPPVLAGFPVKKGAAK